MLKKIIWFIGLLLIAGVGVIYVLPIPNVPFDQLYADVEPAVVQSLRTFRQAHPPHTRAIDGMNWTYITAGQGSEAILFLHGMTGAHDIWWRQMEALSDRYRMIAVTYPPVRSLEALEKGVLTILDAEDIERFNVVGTSLGGYLAQFLMYRHPQKIMRAVLANTFPPNDLIAEKNRVTGKILPLLPEWLLLKVFRGNFENTIFPTSGHDKLTLAFLNEIGYGRMSKDQLIERYHCVIEKFPATSATVPTMIIESDNDPLVAAQLREQLRSVIQARTVHTFSGAGHFPYLNKPQEYTRLLVDFFNEP